MRIFFVIVIISFFVDSFQAFSQYSSSPSNLASFTVNEIKGCAPLTITITANSAGCSTGCAGFPDASDLTNLFSITDAPFPLTYNSPGTYILMLVKGTFQSTITITVYPDTPPEFDLYACNGNKVSLKITDTNYDGGYIVEYPNLTKPLATGVVDVHGMPISPLPQTVKVRGIHTFAADNCSKNVKSVVVSNVIAPPFLNTLVVSNQTTIDLTYAEQPSVLYKSEIGTNSASSFQNLPDVHDTGGNFSVSSSITPTTKFYCFRMRAYDYCTSTPGTYSNIICSAVLDAVAESNQNRITWTTSSSGLNTYTLNRDNTLLSNPLATDIMALDQTVTCTFNYQYQLISNYANGATSTSLSTLPITAISTDPVLPIVNISSIVNPDGNGVALSWPTGILPKEYTIFKTTGSAYNSIGTSTTENFSDDSYTTGSNACYKIQFENLCNNISPFGDVVCPIELTGKLNKDNTVTLIWTPYTNATDYQIEKYDAQGNLITAAFSVGNVNTYVDSDLDTQVNTYKIIAIVGSDQSISNEKTIIKNPTISYPTAFVPNSNTDANKDFKGIGEKFITEIEMKIFNRWGEMVFSTDNISEGWDGTFKGLPMQEGTYAWVADMTDELGRKFKRSGSVVLLRKK